MLLSGYDIADMSENVFLGGGWSSCHKSRKVSNEMYKIGLAKMQNWEDQALTMRVDLILRLNDLKRV